jgi:hypothetical protein
MWFLASRWRTKVMRHRSVANALGGEKPGGFLEILRNLCAAEPS